MDKSLDALLLKFVNEVSYGEPLVSLRAGYS